MTQSTFRRRTRLARSERTMFGQVRRIHMIGIGGTGMCGIAEVLLNLGFTVTGSDARRSDVTERLETLGARIAYDHKSPVVLDADVVVISTAISPDNPELQAARGAGIPVVRRAEMLAELMRMKQGIAVAGSHGKTTTTSMAAHVLHAGGLDPTVVVGGRLKRIGANARVGSGESLLAEADESDGTFLQLQPTWALITNIDREHVDFYPSLDATRDAFVEFANRVPFYGAVIVCLDDPQVQSVLPRIARRVLTYGIEGGADLRATNLSCVPEGSRFDLVFEGENLGTCTLPVPGRHNVSNALAAALLGIELGVEPAEIIAGLEGFDGVGRRLERKGECSGVVVYDDYAHHPREIEATLRAVREQWDGRVVAIFQPHRYSRAAELADDFGRAFYGADTVIVTPIYPAGEEPIEGVDGEMLAGRMRSFGHRDVHYFADFDAISDRLAEFAEPGDMVITLGAGSVWRVGSGLLERLERRAVGPGAPALIKSRDVAAVMADLEGETIRDHPMARCTSFRLGGRADVIFRPGTPEAAALAVARCRDAGIPLLFLGGGTNLLVSDRGIPGVVIAPGAPFRGIEIGDDGQVRSGAGVPLAKLMNRSLREGWAGLEAVAGVPGLVGGAVVMNAGTLGGEIGDRVRAVHGIDRDGEIVTVPHADLAFSYRHSALSELELLLLEIEFQLVAAESDEAQRKAEEIKEYRNRTQPHRVRSAGSAFKNPEGDAAGRMIDVCGLKNTRIGGAVISPVHANYLTADPGATSADVLALIRLCRERVLDRFGIFLELEVRCVGLEREEFEEAAGEDLRPQRGGGQ